MKGYVVLDTKNRELFVIFSEHVFPYVKSFVCNIQTAENFQTDVFNFLEPLNNNNNNVYNGNDHNTNRFIIIKLISLLC